MSPIFCIGSNFLNLRGQFWIPILSAVCAEYNIDKNVASWFVNHLKPKPYLERELHKPQKCACAMFLSVELRQLGLILSNPYNFSNRILYLRIFKL